MFKFLFGVVIYFLVSQNAFAGCVNSPTTDNLERDKACKNITKESECLSTTDNLKCDWSITHTPPAPPEKIVCFPKIAQGQPPNPKDGACLAIKKKSECEQTTDNLDCLWNDKTPPTLSGCVPDALPGQSGNPRCRNIKEQSKCESSTDALKCKWIAPVQQEDPPCTQDCAPAAQ